MTAKRNPATISLDIVEEDTERALDLIRRVRIFAEELQQAGLDVEIEGFLKVTVKAGKEPTP